MIDIEKNIGFLLAKAYQRACAIFKEEFGEKGLTPQQFGLLAFLWQQDGLSQSELSEKSQIDRTTMGGLIDRLEKEGLVKRMPYPEDRRAYSICLTDEGKSLETRLAPIAKRAVRKFTARLSDAEHETLILILEKLRR